MSVDENTNEISKLLLKIMTKIRSYCMLSGAMDFLNFLRYDKNMIAPIIGIRNSRYHILSKVD